MSEVSKTGAISAAVSAGVKSGVRKVAEKSKTPVNMKSQSKAELKEPTKPQQKIKTVTVRGGQCLGEIAEDNKTTVSEIVKHNPGLNPDRIREGQQLKVPYYDPKEWDAYEKKYEAYSKQQREIQHAKEVQQRTNNANKKIKQALKHGWGTDYSFSVDKEGYVIVKPLDKKKLHEIRSDLGLPSGHLDDMNNLEGMYGNIPSVSDGVRDVETWDNVKTKNGDSFRVDPSCIRTERTWTQFFKDLF